MDIPTGSEHIKMIAKLSEENRRLSASNLNSFNSELHYLGVSLSIIYQVATCHRKCFGNAHVFESLCGRAYNLATSAYILICRGLYDEALNLIRSMGEISNLILLAGVDKKALQQWLSLDTGKRIKEFSPFKIRKLLEKANVSCIHADKDWYSKFCEDYTHVNPKTTPNNHDGLNGHVGGKFQSEGIKYALAELTNLSILISIIAAKTADMEDMLEQFETTENKNPII